MLAGKSYGKIASTGQEPVSSSHVSVAMDKDGPASIVNSRNISSSSHSSTSEPMLCTEMVESGTSTFCRASEADPPVGDAFSPVSLIDSLFYQLSSSLNAIMQGKLNKKLPISSVNKRYDMWREYYFILDASTDRLWFFPVSDPTNHISSNRMGASSIPSYITLGIGRTSDYSVETIKLDFTMFSIRLRDSWTIDQEYEASYRATKEFTVATLKARNIAEANRWVRALSDRISTVRKQRDQYSTSRSTSMQTSSYIDLFPKLLEEFTEGHLTISESARQLFAKPLSVLDTATPPNDSLRHSPSSRSDNEVYSRLMGLELELEACQAATSHRDLVAISSTCSFQGMIRNRYLRAAFSVFLDGCKVEANTFLFWQYAEDYRLGHPDASSTSQFQNTSSSPTTLSASSMIAWAEGIYLSFLANNAPFPIYCSTAAAAVADPSFAMEIDRVERELSSLYQSATDHSEIDTLPHPISNSIPTRQLFRELQLKAYALLSDSCYVRFIIQPDYLKLLNLAVFTTINETISTNTHSLSIPSPSTPSTPVSAKRLFNVWNLFSGASKQEIPELRSHISPPPPSSSSSSMQAPSISSTGSPKPLLTHWRESLLTYLQTNLTMDLPDAWWDLFATAVPIDTTDSPHVKDTDDDDDDDDGSQREPLVYFSIHMEQLVRKQAEAETSDPSSSSSSSPRDYHQPSSAHHSASAKYIDNLPQYVRKILLHKAKTLTASYTSSQPISFALDYSTADIGIHIQSSYVRSKFNKIVIIAGNNKRVASNIIPQRRRITSPNYLFTDSTISSIVPHNILSYKADPSTATTIAMASDHTAKASRSAVSYNVSHNSNRESRSVAADRHHHRNSGGGGGGSSIFGTEWVRQCAALFVCMGIPRIHLYDISSHVHRVSINLHKVTKVSPSTTHLYCIELFDDASTDDANNHWSLLMEGVDSDDTSVMTQRWILTIASLVLPSTEVVYILKSGYLKKRGEINTAFKQRWFVLCSDFRLLYYKDHIHGELRGVIDVSYVDDANEPVKRRDKEIMIQMSSLKRTWVLMCDDDDGAKSWVAVLNDLLVSIPPAARFSTIVQEEENEYDDDE